MMDAKRMLAGSVAAVMVLTAFGCQKPVRVDLRQAEMEVAADRFARGGELLEGFELVEAGGWQAGDTVLLGIAMDGPRISRTWYMRATVLEAPEVEFEGTPLVRWDSVRLQLSPRGGEERTVRVDYQLVPVMVELFDERLVWISETVAQMPEICLRYGLADSIELEREGREFYEGIESDSVDEFVAGELQKRNLAGWLALMKLPEFLHRDSMQGVVWQLIERPSLLSIIMGDGVSMSLGMNAKDASEVESELPGVGTVYRAPLAVKVNGASAMECSLLLTKPVPPLGPSSGMLGFDAVNPKNSAKRVTVRLLAAKRVALD